MKKGKTEKVDSSSRKISSKTKTTKRSWDPKGEKQALDDSKKNALNGAAPTNGLSQTLSIKNQEAQSIVASIPLKQFDFSKVSLDSMVGVFGKRRYGKSVWAEHFLSNIARFFPRGGFVFTKTKHNYFWQKHFPENRIYGDLYPELVTQILTEQKNLYKAILNGAEVNSSPFIVVVFDDVISNKDIRYAEQMLELAWAGRHYFIFCVICAQDIKGLPPGFRGNMDLIVTTYQTQRRTMETMQEDFADFFDNMYVFEQLLQQNTTDHGMLIIDQTEAKYDVNDVFFIDQARDPSIITIVPSKHLGDIKVKGPVFKIGNGDYWKAAGNNWKEQLFKAQNVPDPSRELWNEKIEEMSDGDGSDPENVDGTEERDFDAVQPESGNGVADFSENFLSVDRAEDTAKPPPQQSVIDEVRNKLKLLLS